MDMVRRTGQQGVPVTEINGQFVVGFDRPKLAQILGKNRPALGVSVADASQHAPVVGRGAYIGKVRPSSPAQKAGLQKGDVVTELGNRPIPDAATLVSLSKRMATGQHVQVRFVRNGRMRDTLVAL
jgi:putative serine protease PepD